MCGYCTERIAFGVSEQEKRGEKPTLDTFGGSTHYLQATADVSAALTEIAVAADRDNVPVLDLVDGEVVMCRAAELLFTDGYYSPAYQRLLKDSVFRQLLSRARDGSQPVEVIDGCQQLTLLYESSTFTNRKAASKLHDEALSLSECEVALRWYAGWWLGDRCCENKEISLSVMPEDLSSDTTRSEDEIVKLRAIFRPLFFSVVCLSRSQAAKPILLDLVKGSPFGSFDGLDLWLQRQAALSLYDLFSLDPFLANLEKVRASLLHYIDLKRGLTLQQKECILAVVRERPEADRTDDFLTLSDWLG